MKISLSKLIALASLILLSACSTNVARNNNYDSEKLGTQWGETIAEPTYGVEATRISNTPISLTKITYSSHYFSGRGLTGLSIANGRIDFDISNERGEKYTLVSRSNDDFSLSGNAGDAYRLHFKNLSNHRYEVVATVDGLDVLNGRPGSLANNGYILDPGASLMISGFRKNSNEIAAFRLSATADAYAANSAAGNINNTGVIGVAIFELNDANQTRKAIYHSQANPFPGDSSSNQYAPPPRYQ